jgi:hypothetical protein
MLGDAETAQSSPRYEPLTVADVGVVTARRPLPNAVAALAMAANSALTDSERSDYLVRFVSEHLHPDELERVYVAMMLGDAPTNSIDLIARAVTTWGTARPYLAVVTLAVMTAHHWRTIRLKLVQSGVHDPMALPTMHILLDATEAAVLEAMSGDRDSAMKRTLFIDRLYSPLADPATASQQPRGFTDDDTEDAFDAFAAAAR